MDAEIEGTLGLNVLYTPPHGEATVEYDFRLDGISSRISLYSDIRCSIVAVHGLGANPQYAWVAKVRRILGALAIPLTGMIPQLIAISIVSLREALLV